ncbi:MAG: bacteriohopanetetrol glucosamine biosynthesis glycosyltransferase HpnI [Bryobacteraceae bacterium]
MTAVLAIACAVAAVYQAVALVASLRHAARRDPAPAVFPPVSILKPVRGADPRFLEAIRTHAVQDYPEFEIVFGAENPEDPAVEAIQALQSEFPSVAIRFVECPTQAPNGKVGVLMDLAREARHDVLLVSDSDIAVPPGYLRSVVAPLEDAGVGLVTCLYRARSSTLAGVFEAIGIATDFVPGTLVAPLVGVREFGLGSTLVFRRADLEAIGGFAAISHFIADDYQLARRITQLGRRVHLSRTVVETTLGDATWEGVWRHQVRWARTIRVSRGAYVGLPVTFATVWALAAWLGAPGLRDLAAGLIALRMAVAFAAGWIVLRSTLVLWYPFLVPFRDFWGVAVWAAGLFGNKVRWRDRSIVLRRDGRIASARLIKTVDLRR